MVNIQIVHVLLILYVVVSFDDACDLLIALNKFIGYISNMGCVIDVLSIDNDFSQILYWESSDECFYYHLLVNVLIYDNLTMKCMIGEIAFILKWLHQFGLVKKMVHKLYTVLDRRQHIQNFTYENDDSHKIFHFKTETLVSENNMNSYAREILWSPNVVFSLINDKYETNIKMFQLFASAMYHFAKNTLGLKIHKIDMVKNFYKHI